jgi:hypothetical protein
VASISDEGGSGSLLGVVKAFLLEEGWFAGEAPDEPFVTATIEGEHASWPFAAWVPDANGPIVCYSVLVDEVPPERRQEVAALLAELNFRLLVGSFEMDPADGEIRLRISVGSVASR